MRKFLVILVALIGFSFCANAQNVVIQTNDAGKSETKDDCAYRINGICTTEDLGGVEARPLSLSGGWYKFELENYNDFTVSVIFEVGDATGTMILKTNEKRRHLFLI